MVNKTIHSPINHIRENEEDYSIDSESYYRKIMKTNNSGRHLNGFKDKKKDRNSNNHISNHSANTNISQVNKNINKSLKNLSRVVSPKNSH